MRSHPFQFQGAERTALFGQTWLPDTPPKASLAIVHGMTEHSGRYAHLAAPLTQAGIAVHAFDLRGHGRSGGPRGHLARHAHLCEDVRLFLRQLPAPQPPCFLLGHSLGSLPALHLAIHSPATLRGLILSGTALEPSGIKAPHLLRLARLLSCILPRFSIPLPRAPYPVLARDPAVEAAFHADPLTLRAITARFATESLALIDFLRTRLDALRVPFLLLHGGADPVNALEGAQRLLKTARSTDKQLLVYPDNLHEPFHDSAKDQAIADLRSWMLARC
ncbi:MAG: hypothetical protein RLZZ142_1850 [Verrucomicrobiota bacterium]